MANYFYNTEKGGSTSNPLSVAGTTTPIAGSSGVGGGNMIYFSPQDFSVAYTAATQVTLSGLSYTPDIEQFLYVAVTDASGVKTIYYPDVGFAYAAGVLTVTGATFDATDLGYVVAILGPDKAYNMAHDAMAVVGGEAVGGGLTVYFSPEDFTATYASAITLTLAGLTYTPDIEQFLYVDITDASGNKKRLWPKDYAFAYAAGVLTVTGAGFAAGDLGYIVAVMGPDKAYDATNDALKTETINWPVDGTSHPVDIDLTNQAATTYYYPSSSGFSMVGYRHCTIDAETNDATLTIEARNDANGTWKDISLSALDLVTNTMNNVSIGTAGTTDSAVWLYENLNMTSVRVAVVTTDATNAYYVNVRLMP